MNNVEHLLVILMEECAEVSQRASKILRFGWKEIQPGQKLDNTTRLEGEINDLLGTIKYLEIDGFILTSPAAAKDKMDKIDKYMEYSRNKCGTLS